jgi:hypothetical protein
VYKPLFVVLLFAIMFPSCETKVSDDTALVLLFDKSKSTAPTYGGAAKGKSRSMRVADTEDMRAGYLVASRSIVAEAGPGTTVMGGCINDKPLRLINVPISVELPAFDAIWENEFTFRDDLKEKKREAAQQIRQAIDGGEPAADSCIVESLLLAEQLFSKSDKRRKVLVLFTDLIQDCGNVDFDEHRRAGTRGLPRNQGEVQSLLEELGRQGHVPDLRGVEVCIYGATGGQQEEDNASRYIRVRKFWDALLVTAGATVKDYGVFRRYPFASNSSLNVPVPADGDMAEKK